MACEVSVVIPVKNRPKELKRAIQSVLNQSFKNFEIIVVDDNSTQDIEGVCKNFNNSRIKYYKNNFPSNGNPGRARNIGILKSKGYFIAFLDSDDIWIKNKLDTQLKFMKKEGLSFLSSNAFELSNNKKTKNFYLNYLKSNLNFFSLFLSNYIITSSVIIKKNLLSNNKLYFPVQKFFCGFEDYYLWIKVSLSIKNLKTINSPLLYYTVDSKDSPRYLGIFNPKLVFSKIFIIILIYILTKKFSFKNIKEFFIIFFLKLYYILKSKIKFNKTNNSTSLSLKFKKDLISVILPVHNGSAFIEQSINSILNQTYQNFELIIIDDGSTDNTNMILSQFTDNRIRLFKNKSRIGISKSLNYGIFQAKGRYIARADCDDINFTNRLETQYNIFQKEKEIDICSSAMITFQDKFYKKITYKYQYIDIDPFIKYPILLSLHNPVFHPTAMIKKKFFKRNKYNPYFDSIEDWDLWIRAIKRKYKIFITKKPLIYYRYHDKSFSKISSEKHFLFKNRLLNCHKSFLFKKLDIKSIKALNNLNSFREYFGIYEVFFGKSFFFDKKYYEINKIFINAYNSSIKNRKNSKLSDIFFLLRLKISILTKIKILIKSI